MTTTTFDPTRADDAEQLARETVADSHRLTPATRRPRPVLRARHDTETELQLRCSQWED